jgi:uncharacterized membrane protein YidH (DUF202 family)
MRNFLGIVSFVFGFFGFLLMFGGVFQIESDPAGFSRGIIQSLIGVGAMILVAVGWFFYNCFQLPPSIPKWEKERRKRLGLCL